MRGPHSVQNRIRAGALSGRHISAGLEHPNRGVMDDVAAKGQGWRGGAGDFLDVDASHQDRRGVRTGAAGQTERKAAQKAEGRLPESVHNLFITRSRPASSRDMMGRVDLCA